MSAGLTGDLTKIKLSTQSPKQYLDYCGNTTGCTSNSLQLSLAWTHDTRDNIQFPKRGVYQQLSSEVGIPGLDLEYYKLEYQHAWYKDISKNLTLLLNGELGYADNYGGNVYPFFKNFYAGGVNSVRGFSNGSLGPQDTDPVTKLNFAVGGTRRIVGNAELFAPIPLLKDSKQFRLSAFLDSGDVWGSNQSVNLGDLRYSAGVGVSWFSPFGPLKLLYAKPLKSKPGDKTESIQFQLGKQF